MHCLISTTKKKLNKIFESVSKFYIYHLRKHMINLRFIFMNLYKFNAKNKNINLYSRFCILFIRN
jgi:hypothetical protein